jgi:hypothetical protein
VPLDRPGGGSGARSHHAKQGGRHIRRPVGRQHGGSLIGIAGWEQLLMRSGVIQHGMQEMNPLIRMRLGHAKELSLYVLDGILFDIGQHEEQLVGYRR